MHKQRGSAIIAMILAIVVVMAMIGAAVVQGVDTAGMVSNNNAIQTVVAQASLIRSKLNACAVEYPSGDNGNGFRPPYPASLVPASVATRMCPGAAINLWSMGDAVSFPPTPAGTGGWQYVNDATSLRILLTSNTAEMAALLGPAAARLGPQASTSGTSPNVTLTWVLAQ